MKKLLSLIVLLSITSAAFADYVARRPVRRRVIQREVVGPVYTEELYPETEVIEEPIYYEDYDDDYPRRAVSGVVEGAEEATEGVVSGAARAVRSVLP